MSAPLIADVIEFVAESLDSTLNDDGGYYISASDEGEWLRLEIEDSETSTTRYFTAEFKEVNK